MTIKELIEKLSEFDTNMNVKILVSFDCGYGWEGGDITSFEVVDDEKDWDTGLIKPAYLRLINDEG